MSMGETSITYLGLAVVKNTAKSFITYVSDKIPVGECRPPSNCLPNGRFGPVQCRGDRFTGRYLSIANTLLEPFYKPQLPHAIDFWYSLLSNI